jgi:hypothetical protein
MNHGSLASRRSRFGVRLLAVVMIGLVALGRVSGAEEATGDFRWTDIWGFPDCLVKCNPNVTWCVEDPLCNCDCTQD